MDTKMLNIHHCTQQRERLRFVYQALYGASTAEGCCCRGTLNGYPRYSWRIQCQNSFL
jgi:hypothetical protein